MFNKKEPRLAHYKHKELYVCENCMYWTGKIYARRHSCDVKLQWITITCLCQSIECEVCHYNRPRPGSQLWSLGKTSYMHVPAFVGIRPCIECGGKMVKD